MNERDEWNLDYAIVDGPGYPDLIELNNEIVFVESNK